MYFSCYTHNLSVIVMCDMQYFALLPITIMAHKFYHNIIIITMYIPFLYEQYIDIDDTCSAKH